MSVTRNSAEPRSLFSASITTGLWLAGIGLAVWVGLSAWSGLALEEEFRLREAWDSWAYFIIGVPLMAMAVGLAAYSKPRRTWRWPVWLVGGHQAGVLIVGLGTQSGLSTVILAIILAVLLAALFAVPALIGVLARLHMAERAY